MTYSFGEEQISPGPRPSDENNVRGAGWTASRGANGYTLSWISGEHGGGELSAEISEEEFERLRANPGAFLEIQFEHDPYR